MPETSVVLALVAPSVALLASAVTQYIEYKWRRRKYAVDLLEHWNNHTKDLRAKLVQWKPGILEGPVFLQKDEAAAIYSATEKNALEIRSCIIGMLNYCEFVVVAYVRKVANREMLDASIMSTIVDWYESLREFVLVATDPKHRARDPWVILTRFVQVRKPHSPRAASGDTKIVESLTQSS